MSEEIDVDYLDNATKAIWRAIDEEIAPEIDDRSAFLLATALVSVARKLLVRRFGIRRATAWFKTVAKQVPAWREDGEAD